MEGLVDAFSSDSDEEEGSLDFTSLTRPSPPLPLPQYPAGAEEDDGWLTGSDVEEIVPKLTSPKDHDERFFSKFPKPFMHYDDDAWVDEAAAVFAAHMKTEPARVSDALREMFSAHGSVYCLLLAFYQRVKRSRDKKVSLRRVVRSEFSLWICERKASGKPLNNMCLTPEHQKKALQILTYCHPVYMDDICLLFELKSAAIADQLGLIHCLLAECKHKVAVTYVWKFGLQEHFSMRQMLLPLVDLDKINMIENYIEGSRKLQEEFVSMVDKLCQPGANLYLEDCGTSGKQGNKDNSKLNHKQLYKMGIRFVFKYDLDLDMFPHLAQKKTSGALHFLLQKIYVKDSSITAKNRDDLIKAAVEGRPHLQSQLIGELTGHFKDLPAAAYWSHELALPSECLPPALQQYLEEEHSPPTAPVGGAEGGKVSKESSFLALSLPMSAVYFVDGRDSLQSCWERLTQPGSVIGIDAEWCLSACNRGRDRLALLQLAVKDAVFLLDPSSLQLRVDQGMLVQFCTDIFTSPSLLKLGYGIAGDLSMLARTWKFAVEPLSQPQRVVDLQTLAKMVKKLLQCKDSIGGSSHSISELPAHPLTGSAPPPQQQLQTTPAFSKPDVPFTALSKKCLKHVCPTSMRGASPSPPPPPSPPRCHVTSSRGRQPDSQATGPTLKERYLRTLEELQSSNSPSPVSPAHQTKPQPTTEQSTSPQCGTPSPVPVSAAVKGTGEAAGVRGLSLLVQDCLGRPLDKSQQFSDWKRRPLHREQVKYAALDAYCLLAVYEKLKSQALKVDANFNMEPALPGSRR